MSTRPPDELAAQLADPSARRAASVGFPAAFAIAAVLAVALSLQFLVQPFVWRNWPLDEILIGWLYVLRDCALTAFLMTPPVLWATRLPARAVAGKLLMIGAGAAAAAGVGEAAVRTLDGAPPSPGYLASHALRWAIVALVVTGVILLLQRRRFEREALRQETLRRVRLDEQLSRAHLAALQSQIEPHFLFNTLGTVRHLHRLDRESAARLLDSFLEYLRAMLRMSDRPTVPLGEEIALVASYLAIVRARMPDRLAVSIEVPDDLARIAVPPWAVSTLVENAIKHGIAPLERGGTIRVSATRAGAALVIRVADDGRGLGGGMSAGSGIGLSNVRARLAALFRNDASLVVANGPAGGVIATLVLPALEVEP